MNTVTQKRFVDELFEDLESRYKRPSPAVLAENVKQFENFLTKTLLPFVGVNGFLIGTIVYEEVVGNIAAPLVLAALLLIGWWLLVPPEQRRAAWLQVGGIATIGLMALIAVPNTLVAVLLGFLWSVAFAVVILRRWIPEHASLVYLGYLPWLVTTQLEPHVRVMFELATVVPMAAVFLMSGRRVASLAAIATAVIVGKLEFSRVGQGDVGLVMLTFAGLVLAIIYEWRIAKTDVSALREFAGHGLPTALAFMAIAAIMDVEEAFAWWLWAAVVALYQGGQYWREGGIHPTRVAWVVLTLAVCTWSQLPSLPWHTKATITLALAAMLHMFAAWRGRAFIATIALLIAAFNAAVVMLKSQDHVALHIVAVGALLVAFFLLAARSRPASETIPWARGFIQPEHAQWLRRIGLGALAQLLRIPLVGAIFGWCRTGFTWLSFATGRPGGLDIGDLAFIAAHAFGAVLVSNQLVLLLSQETSTGWTSPVLGAVWIPWGVALAIAGSRSGVLFQRVCGMVLIVSPVAAELAFIQSGNTAAIAMLAIMTGVGLWLACAAVSQARQHEDAEPIRVGDPS